MEQAILAERHVASQRVNELQAHVQQLQAQVSSLRNDAARLSAVRNLELPLARTCTVTAATARLNDQERAIIDQNRQLEAAGRDLVSVRDQLAQAHGASAPLQREMQRLQKELEASQRANELLRLQLENARSGLVSRNVQLRQQNEQLDTGRQQVHGFEATLKTVREEATKKIDELTAKASQNIAAVHQAVQAANAAATSVASTRQEADAWKAHALSKEAAVKNLQNQLQQRDAQLKAARHEFEVQRSKTEEAQKEAQRRESLLMKRVRDLEASEREVRSVKAKLAKEREESLQKMAALRAEMAQNIIAATGATRREAESWRAEAQAKRATVQQLEAELGDACKQAASASALRQILAKREARLKIYHNEIQLCKQLAAVAKIHKERVDLKLADLQRQYVESTAAFEAQLRYARQIVASHKRDLDKYTQQMKRKLVDYKLRLATAMEGERTARALLGQVAPLADSVAAQAAAQARAARDRKRAAEQLAENVRTAVGSSARESVIGSNSAALGINRAQGRAPAAAPSQAPSVPAQQAPH